MSIKIEMNRQKETCIFKVVGRISLEEFRQSMDPYVSGEPPENTLWDLTEADLSGLSAADLEEISRMRSLLFRIRKPGKTAVAAPANVLYGMARMVQGMSPEEGDSPYHVFRDLESAWAWLEEK